jgi:mannose-6-phosphate isomerase-like protein (cupin superfamily)
MADFTKVNLRGEVEDAAPKFDISPEVEAHFAHDDLDATVTGLSYQRLEPNARMPFGHSHEKQEEIYLVLSGRGRIKLDGEIVDLAPLDAVRIAAPTMRAVEAGSEGIEYVVFGAPRGDQNDAQMVQEWWAQTDG